MKNLLHVPGRLCSLSGKVGNKERGQSHVSQSTLI